jgi:hypothetical protein
LFIYIKYCYPDIFSKLSEVLLHRTIPRTSTKDPEIPPTRSAAAVAAKTIAAENTGKRRPSYRGRGKRKAADTHSALDQLHGSASKRTRISQPPTMIPGIAPTAISANSRRVTVEEVIDKDDPQAQATSA